MDNNICDFETLQSPNRRYAKTVNISFFKAMPTTKDFKIYIDGLRRWKEYKKLFPECQIQFFVDEYVGSVPEFQQLFQEIGARVYKFECPDYLRKDNFHIGLFGTMLRFFPTFDVNKHALSVAHIQELEPSTDDDIKHLTTMNAVGSKNMDVAFFYAAPMSYDVDYRETPILIEKSVPFPHVLAGRCAFKEKVPFSLFSKFLKQVNSGKKFEVKYKFTPPKPEHGKYSFGVDEMFLNAIVLPYLISQGKGIGIVLHYTISETLYYMRSKIQKDKRTLGYLNYILNENHTSTQSGMRDFDVLFYKKTDTPRAKECAPRFYALIEQDPDWLGKENTYFILKAFRGYIKRDCVLVVRNRQIEKILDLR